ncbi:aspartate-semialdehyde dehydrogenase [Nadsonia fulvescens var. elongata DSM 6958]|uniref:Aspartate-semialdehyde dehydrogenase n=1 Tax=Nadsonia fulvescens var. elongata DSM 6958 TaxID=857566 RepID=A0A1E3PQ94_9ASCO|nr:aspartate-semialdehyde dehydrogenase [Nadsonia fulvescens var. elongata DSM 6958]
MAPTKKAGVLGATGSVGQRFILLLSEHPDFELAVLGASSRSAGKKYSDAVDWKQTSILPEQSGAIVVSECKPENFADCDVVFSGLDADYAGDIEKAFVDAGLVIISNAKNYRREPSVPLVVPTANAEHLDIFTDRVLQSKSEGKKQGYQICISNCSTAGLVVPLKALQDKFGPIDTVTVTTMQAVSGAGFSPGVPSMDVLDNLVPFISGEEDKMEWETKKILGGISANGVDFIPVDDNELRVSAQCNRVAVIDGHTECVSFKFKNRPAPSVEQVKNCLSEFVSQPQRLGCYSAPKKAIYVLEQSDRPQPRLDRNRDNGYAVSVGRVREDPVLDFKFVALSHNTIIGAAGSGILIAETLLAKSLI